MAFHSTDCSHGVSYKRGLLQPVILYEAAHVLAHGRVVMAWVVGGFAVVSEILLRVSASHAQISSSLQLFLSL